MKLKKVKIIVRPIEDVKKEWTQAQRGNRFHEPRRHCKGTFARTT